MSVIHIQLDLILEKCDCKLVPWQIIEDETEVPDDYGDEWPEMLGLFETQTWWSPAAELGEIQPGERIHIKGPATITYTRDYYGEDDVWLDFDDKTTEVKILKEPEET